ncbi:MAG: ABC transporter permease [Oscillospiraceae bacterium]|nr:ABC transporter permease [Oscillospiraceae bacterium]
MNETQSGDAYIYTVATQGEYVGQLKFEGSLENIEETASFYTSDTKEQLLAAENGHLANVSLKGGDAYITVDCSSPYLHIALKFEGDFEVKSATLNPTSLVFSFTSIFICSCGLLLVASAILIFTLLRGSLSGYTEIAGKYRHLVSNLITRDLKVKYRRSMLGFLWSILNPLLMALVINAVFQNLFRFDIDYFIVYYLTGSLIFNFMTEATTSSLVSVLNAASLIKKVYIPKYIFPLEKCLFAFVNMLFSSVAVIIVIFIQRMPLHLTALLFFFPMVCAFVFSLGLSLMLSSVNVFFRDIGHLYSVWTTAWMYLTPIIYPVSILPDGLMTVMRLNPMYYYVSYFRDVVMYGIVPDVQTHLICIIYALLFFVFGLCVFKKQQDRFILYI